jgi:hypothetical protein
VALNIRVGIQAGGTNGSRNFEAIIVSNLEFLGLRKHQDYEHRQPIEVKSEVVVAPDLSGALVKEDCPTGKIISASQAEANEKRVNKADKRIDELLKAKRLGNGKTPTNGNGARTSVQMKLALIVMPAEPVPSHWWAQLTSGTGDRELSVRRQ